MDVRDVLHSYDDKVSPAHGQTGKDSVFRYEEPLEIDILPGSTSSALCGRSCLPAVRFRNGVWQRLVSRSSGKVSGCGPSSTVVFSYANQSVDASGK